MYTFCRFVLVLMFLDESVVVHMHIYVYMDTYLSIYIHIHTYIHIYVCIYICTELEIPQRAKCIDMFFVQIVSEPILYSFGFIFHNLLLVFLT